MQFQFGDDWTDAPKAIFSSKAALPLSLFILNKQSPLAISSLWERNTFSCIYGGLLNSWPATHAKIVPSLALHAWDNPQIELNDVEMTGDLIYDSIATYNGHIFKLYAAGFQPISDKISKKNLDLLKQ